MKILALNCGSSSIKYKLFEMGDVPRLLLKGMVDKIGYDPSFLRYTVTDRRERTFEKCFKDHHEAFQAVFDISINDNNDIAVRVEQIKGIGHRVVHGGRRFTSPVLVTPEICDELQKFSKFAPLHNRPSVLGIEVCRKLLPDAPNIAVFDTAIHQTIPPKAFLYGLPKKLCEKHGIRKYGFHGTSHGYVGREAARIIGRPFEDLKIITCHLGNGISITAFDKGQSVDTSMGMTPLEGLVMGTRSGDIDPSIVLYLIETEGLNTTEVQDLLNRKSGLKGLCGYSDVRDIIKRADNGDKDAQTAIDVFVYRIQKYIGAYAAALNGVDVIVFTAGIGENSPYIRGKVLDSFAYLGIEIDKDKNERNQTIFSTDTSAVYAMAIPTNEELVIAQIAYRLIARKKELCNDERI